MKSFNLYLIIPFLALGCANIDAAAAESKTSRLGIGLELSPLVEKIENQSKPSFWKSGCLKPTAPLCSGLKIALAFETHRLEVIDIEFSAVKKYTIPQVLMAFDNSICRALVYEKNTRKLDFNNLSPEDLKILIAIKKHYFDVLPIALRKNYGAAAEVYIPEINRARREFEAKNNGALLELRD